MTKHPTLDEIAKMVETATRLGQEFVHFEVPRRRAPKGLTSIRLLGLSGPHSSMDKRCERVRREPLPDGRRIEIWSAWWRVEDLRRYVAKARRRPSDARDRAA